LALSGNHPRCARGASRSRRLSRDGARYGGNLRKGRGHRAGRGAGREGPGCRRPSPAVGAGWGSGRRGGGSPRPPPPPPRGVVWLLDATAIGGSSSPAAPQPTHCRVWVAVNKIDLIGSIEKERIELRFNKELTVHFISSATGEGVDHLAAELSRFAGEFFPREPALVTRA